MEKENVTPSPEADRRTLIRRLSLDLLGLPPTPEQIQAFLADDRPDAYEWLVDALLDSPHFGERWGRHWLDLARYADTSGYQIDRPRPFAFLFRDWVIDSINGDMPFDQFTIEQLAGDLLPNASINQKIAAGFHRLTLMNHEDGVDAEEFRCKAKVDRVSTTATVWLGLTLGCAECHNHKYDPVSQREFYQFYAFFNNADEVDVPMPQANDPTRFEREHKAWEAEHARLQGLLAQVAQAKDVYADEGRRLLTRHRRSEPKKIDAQAMTFQERTNAARAQIHVRGDFLRVGEETCAATPAVLNPFNPRCAKADRLDLAHWIVAPANPLTARVAVNHVWVHLFGRGLVASTEDFGTRGERPSHPELLDWLALSFVAPVRAPPGPFLRGEGEAFSDRQHLPPSSTIPALETNPPLLGVRASHLQPSTLKPQPALNWSRKALIKLMVTSSTYRQSSNYRPELTQRDPLNVLLARQNRFRLESETLRDLYLATSGLLNDDIGGPSFRPHLTDDVKQLGTAGAFSWIDTDGPEKYRRGLYIFAQRTVPYPASMAFDQADPTQTCTRRERSNTPLQALTLLNHGIFVECAQALGKRLTDIPAKDPRERLERGFELCLARKPAKAELDRFEKLFCDQLALARANPAASAKLAGLDLAHSRLAEAASLVALSQVLMNLDEFMTRE
jgi:hypothetical protein